MKAVGFSGSLWSFLISFYSNSAPEWRTTHCGRKHFNSPANDTVLSCVWEYHSEATNERQAGVEKRPRGLELKAEEKKKKLCVTDMNLNRNHFIITNHMKDMILTL